MLFFIDQPRSCFYYSGTAQEGASTGGAGEEETEQAWLSAAAKQAAEQTALAVSSLGGEIDGPSKAGALQHLGYEQEGGGGCPVFGGRRSKGEGGATGMGCPFF